MADGRSKHCPGCGESKRIDEFRWQSDAKMIAGGHYTKACKACERIANAARARKRRAKHGRGDRTREYDQRARTAGHIRVPLVVRRARLALEIDRLREQRIRESAAISSARAAFDHWMASLAPAGWKNEYARQYAARLASRVRRRYWTLREAEIARVATYKRSNPDRNREWSRTRLARERRQGGLSSTDLAAIRFGADECLYCGAILGDANRCVDHMDPLATGGGHDESNVVACCRRCNARKSSMPFSEWLRQVPTDRLLIVANRYVDPLGVLGCGENNAGAPRGRNSVSFWGALGGSSAHAGEA